MEKKLYPIVIAMKTNLDASMGKRDVIEEQGGMWIDIKNNNEGKRRRTTTRLFAFSFCAFLMRNSLSFDLFITGGMLMKYIQERRPKKKNNESSLRFLKSDYAIRYRKDWDNSLVWKRNKQNRVRIEEV